MCISDERTESSKFDSLMPITAALDKLAIFLSFSILGNKLLNVEVGKMKPPRIKNTPFTLRLQLIIMRRTWNLCHLRVIAVN